MGAPPATAFARYPASWYLLCSARALRKGPVSVNLLGRQIVALRTAAGKVAVMDARCSHLGADLSKGQVVGECIRCPFHGWEYGIDGRCVAIPKSAHIPGFAKQNVYPSMERHGLIFFFNGAEPLFPLPFFHDAWADDFIASAPTTFIANSCWYMVAAHGYDLPHFETVHGRKLLTPLSMDCPAPFARRSRYRAEIVGNKYYDHFLRLCLSREVTISITTWGGTLVLITGDLGRARSTFMIALQPLDDGQTRCDVIVFAERSRSVSGKYLLDPLSLALRRLLTRGYLVDEVNQLGNPRYRPEHLIDTDRAMIEYFQWAAGLPQAADKHLACDPARPEKTNEEFRIEGHSN